MNKVLYFQKHIVTKEIFQTSIKTTVGIHGIFGSFNDQAWDTYVKEELELPREQFEIKELVHAYKVLEAVANKTVDFGIFAVANSGSGGCQASVEAMGVFNFELVSLFSMPITMCLLAHKDITDITQIDTFFGHPTALSQCRKTLENSWPNISVKPATDEIDTALSAKMLSERALPKSYAVFASKRAAERYGLNILFECVHDDPNNATSFAVIRHKD